MIRSIAIGGFMGVGKSSVGRQVAEMLNVGLVDLDQRVSDAFGLEISDVFARFGEEAFRTTEAREVRSALSGAPVVLALGGGTLHYGDNCRVVRGSADLVCLGMSLEGIRMRIGDTDPDRPLWENAAALYTRRQPLYQAAGHYIDVTGLSLEAVAERVIEVCGCN